MTPQPDNSQTVSTQVRALSTRVKDLLKVMRTQQDMLRTRGLKLPTEAMSSLKQLKDRVDGLQQNVGGMQIELTQLRALADTTALIASTLDVDEVLNQVMDTVVRLTGAERGYIVLKNKETGEMEFRVARGIDQEQLDQSEFIVSRTIVNRVTETAAPVLTDNASADPRFQEQKSIVGFALRSILAVPLTSRDDVIGVVYCDNRILAGVFREHEKNLLTAFADQAGVAIENARLFADARNQLNEVTSVRDLMNNIFSSVASGIVTINTDSTVTTLNAAAEQILGAEPGSILGQQLLDIIPGDTTALADAIAEVAASDNQTDVEMEPELPGRGRRNWNLIVSPLHDERDGSVEGIVIVLDDLTEIKERQAQLEQVRNFVPMGNIENIKSETLSNMKVEVREITALFCDVRGFTTFSENLEPEDLMRVINRYLSLASDAINLYEGIVDKYMGDAVTGLFNTQLNPQEDHAVRCVRAAMSMVFDLKAQHEVMPEDQRLFYGTGIHTGPAVLGNTGGGGREEFSAMGEAMEICKVLQENAGPGEVIISEKTYEYVQDMFECEEIVPEKTKGYEIALAYRVVRRKKGTMTGPLMLDPELMALLEDNDS
ncbi:MAG: GAF domain-containing protein [Chloroflexota bacterium]